MAKVRSPPYRGKKGILHGVSLSLALLQSAPVVRLFILVKNDIIISVFPARQGAVAVVLGNQAPLRLDLQEQADSKAGAVLAWVRRARTLHQQFEDAHTQPRLGF
jgi:hypothetical protein